MIRFVLTIISFFFSLYVAVSLFFLLHHFAIGEVEGKVPEAVYFGATIVVPGVVAVFATFFIFLELVSLFGLNKKD